MADQKKETRIVKPEEVEPMAGMSVTDNVTITHRRADGSIKNRYTIHNDFVGTGVTWTFSRWRGQGTNSTLIANNNMFVQFGSGSRGGSFTQIERNQGTTTSNAQGVAANEIECEAVYNYTSASTVINFLRLQVGTVVVADTGVLIASPSPGDSIGVTWTITFNYRDNTAANPVDKSVINTIRETVGGTDQGTSHLDISASDVRDKWTEMCYTGAPTPSNYSWGRLRLYSPTGTPPPLIDSSNKVNLLHYETLTTTGAFQTNTFTYTFTASWPSTSSQSGAQRYRWWIMELSNSSTGTYIGCANGVWDNAVTLPQIAISGNVAAALTIAGSI